LDSHALALAYSLSSISGLRASLSIFAVTLAIHFHIIAPPAGLSWLTADSTICLVGALAVADFFADKVPVVDHALHVVHLALAPAAGAISASAADPSGSHLALVALLGALNAFGVHSAKSTVRLGTSAMSLGLLTPIISMIEDLFAAAALAIAFVAPFLIAAIAAVLTILTAVAGHRVIRWLARKRARSAA